MGKRELVALLNLSSWCLVTVEQLFLAVPWGCLRLLIVVFPDYTHLLFLQKAVWTQIRPDKMLIFHLKESHQMAKIHEICSTLQS